MGAFVRAIAILWFILAETLSLPSSPSRAWCRLQGASNSSVGLNHTVSNVSRADRKHMARAIELAARARGNTRPNPCVGCVIVDSSGAVVGEGFHPRAGLPHAEVWALRQAADKAIGGTAYVSLEPCNHFGRTPPCSRALVKAGIRRVVSGTVDPDPRVSSSGLAYLKNEAVEVVSGVEESSCLALNTPFLFRVQHGRPYLIAWQAWTHNLQTVAGCLPEVLSKLAPDTDTIVMSGHIADSILQASTNIQTRVLSGIPIHVDIMIANCTASDEAVRRLNDTINSFNANYTGEEWRLKHKLYVLSGLLDRDTQLEDRVMKASKQHGSNSVLLIAGDENLQGLVDRAQAVILTDDDVPIDLGVHGDVSEESIFSYHSFVPRKYTAKIIRRWKAQPSKINCDTRISDQ